MTPVEVHHEAPPVNPEDVEAETQKVLQQLEGIECSVSKADPSINAKKQDNRLYGLHALNNLDIITRIIFGVSLLFSDKGWGTCYFS